MHLTTLVTGVTGFIGSRLKEGRRGLVRSASNARPQDVVGDILDIASLRKACADMQTVIHCAGYAHAVAQSDAKAHWQINYEGTRNLVDAALQMGVKQIIFLSSVKAVGSPGDRCVSEDWAEPPTTPYGLSKRAAEEYLLNAGVKSGMNIVNLRLAMTYGQGGRGNLERMVRAVQAGYFPPIPQSINKRSIIHVDDVISAVDAVLNQPIANGKTYNVASRAGYSARDLLDAIREVSGLAPIRWAVPSIVWKIAGRIGDGLNKISKEFCPLSSEVVSRLLEPECYSSALIERELSWRAKVDLRDGLREMCSYEARV